LVTRWVQTRGVRRRGEKNTKKGGELEGTKGWEKDTRIDGIAALDLVGNVRPKEPPLRWGGGARLTGGPKCFNKGKEKRGNERWQSKTRAEVLEKVRQIKGRRTKKKKKPLLSTVSRSPDVRSRDRSKKKGLHKSGTE